MNPNYKTELKVSIHSNKMDFEDARNDSCILFNLLINLMIFKRHKKIKYLFRAFKNLYNISKDTEIKIVALGETEAKKVRESQPEVA